MEAVAGVARHGRASMELWCLCVVCSSFGVAASATEFSPRLRVRVVEAEGGPKFIHSHEQDRVPHSSELTNAVSEGNTISGPFLR